MINYIKLETTSVVFRFNKPPEKFEDFKKNASKACDAYKYVK